MGNLSTHRMKRILVILLITNLKSFGQDLPRHYKDYFGNDLTLFKDSTFINKWRYDLTVIWEAGYWKRSNDTIYFTPRHIFDTVNCKNRDSLILSFDNKPNRISCEEFSTRIGYSSSQRDTLIPFKLFDKEDKLYIVKRNGKLLKKAPGEIKKISIRKESIEKRQIVLYKWTKKYPAYFYRQID